MDGDYSSIDEEDLELLERKMDGKTSGDEEEDVFEEEGELEEMDTDEEKGDAKRVAFVKETSFQKYQRRMAGKIAEFERDNIEERHWSMRGEVSAKMRQPNSLLEQVVEFEQTSKPVPIITEQVTEGIEEMIRKRIKDEQWDDPMKLDVNNPEYLAERQRQAMQTKRILPDPSTSKPERSLAAEYAHEYEKRHGSTEKTVSGIDVNDSLREAKESIISLWEKISHGLDVLCHNENLVGVKMQETEEEIVNVPVYNLEESLPIVVGHESTLAPEEIHAPSRPPKSKEETSGRSLHLKKKRKIRNGQVKKRDGLLPDGAPLKTIDRHMKKQALQELVKKKNVVVMDPRKKKPAPAR